MAKIVVRGACTHNLKSVDVELPRGALVVITGPSGSGKSSLAFDTIYVEGRRRYVESMSAYARQFLDRLERPEVESIEGLSPAVAIEQRSSRPSPRSTVATVTELHDHLRVLYARAGTPHCPRCGTELASLPVARMVDRVLALPPGSRVAICAPLTRASALEVYEALEEARLAGYARAAVGGTILDLAPSMRIPPSTTEAEVYVDRLSVTPSQRGRLAEALERALQLAGGVAVARVLEGDDLTFSEHPRCVPCGYTFPALSPRTFSFNHPDGACPSCGGLGLQVGTEGPRTHAPACQVCGGTRLSEVARSVRVGGLALPEVLGLTVDAARKLFEKLEVDAQKVQVAERVLKEVRSRLSFLADVGLSYLTLDRPAHTLSGGEAQRIRLATQLGARLSGVLYVLDEPSIGLHPRDTEKLLGTLVALRDLGNTVLVVEHDAQTLRAADWLVELGPGAGAEGGRVIGTGTPAELSRNPDSPTGRYLAGKIGVPYPTSRRPLDGPALTVVGARGHNLKVARASFPAGALTVVSGVSGSGKSTLVLDTLERAVERALRGGGPAPAPHDEVLGVENFERVVSVDQAPIGRTSRANPATYCGAWNPIRSLFGKLPEARLRGYGADRFSFNRPGGRCEACKGEGVVRVEMSFLPDVTAPCLECQGKRFDRETLEIRYRGQTIADILEMRIEEARTLFTRVPAVVRPLQALCDVGLGYLALGQPASTLSGGEAQRVKLARELARTREETIGRTLYVLDEPTTGLHFGDVSRLLDILHRLADAGHAVVVIEHNLEVIRAADKVIELGPEGGEAGGRIVAEGTPEQIAAARASPTGAFLKRMLPRKAPVPAVLLRRDS